MYELTQKKLKDLKNEEILVKSQNWVQTKSIAQSHHEEI